jgi:catalase
VKKSARRWSRKPSRPAKVREPKPAAAPGSEDSTSPHAVAVNALAAETPFNANTPLEYGEPALDGPAPGETREPPTANTVASTGSEKVASPKTGAPAEPGESAMDGSLARVRVDSGAQGLTTNQGVLVADNQSSLKAGLRGPTLLEDFILREKITHFDHERIPERIVHARGSGAHGFFECYKPLTRLTRAAPFAEAGKQTPVFARFSTVAGERGSKDTARDVRGFAVKFYTDEGNWDLVGNNMPVFFIQDAIKFPDLVHAVKPEPHHAMPQAASAHDTFWDFVSLMPESTHMLTWLMSDRAIPRSFRMMQGFGVHTFRLVNAKGESTFVKFHWKPLLGTHSLVWDEAVKISGADPDFHRRDLWDAIEAGEFPEWELGIQTFTQAEADGFSFDILDSTKLIPEELVPVKPVGRMVLNRNPDNFFAETEQVAFCTAHIVPGIDFSNDPLLAGRIHSYLDTQISRLGGPNFHEIPINAPLAPVHNNQRDGMHRQAINRGRVSYEPNSLGGGCPFQAGGAGFTSVREPSAEEDKVRGKPEKFAEHYLQARLFFDSQTPVEQRHIIAAFRFELSKVTVPAIRERMVASLVNVSPVLAQGVADGLGMPLPAALPRATDRIPRPDVARSKALSLTALPGEGGIRTRKVALLIADGVDGGAVLVVRDALRTAGAVPRLVGMRLGPVEDSRGGHLHAEGSMETMPAVLFDAVVLPDGAKSVANLLKDGRTLEFIKDQYRHCKTIMALGASSTLLERAGIPASKQTDGGLIVVEGSSKAAVERFIAAVGKHRHPTRDSDPPLI